MQTQLLLDEYPLLVLPSLAVAVGLNQAIVLQQIHYWTVHNRRTGRYIIEGEAWVKASAEEWQRQFPFWSDRTIRGVLTELRSDGLIHGESLDPDPRDRTLYYRIDMAKLADTIRQSLPHAPGKVSEDAPGKVDQMLEEQETISETKVSDDHLAVLQAAVPEAEERRRETRASFARKGGIKNSEEQRLAALLGDGLKWGMRMVRDLGIKPGKLLEVLTQRPGLVPRIQGLDDLTYKKLKEDAVEQAASGEGMWAYAWVQFCAALNKKQAAKEKVNVRLLIDTAGSYAAAMAAVRQFGWDDPTMSAEDYVGSLYEQ